MGVARVVDINDITAIAKLTEQSFEDAVAVGDGIKIYNIPGRVRFARLAGQHDVVDHGAPLTEKSQVTMPLSNPAPKPAPTQPIMKVTQRANIQEPEQEPPERDSDPTPVEQQAEEDTSDYGSNIVGEALKIFRGVDLYAGIDTWKVSGDASAKSELSPWIFNYFAGALRGPFMPNIDVELGGALHLGNAKKGSYTGFDVAAKLVYLIPTEGVISFYRVGALARLESRNISSESFGGGDYILGGAFGGAEGRMRYVDVPLEWQAELALLPIGIGQIGSNGNKKTMSGAFGYELDLGVVKPSEERDGIDWGGTLGVSSIDMEAGGSFTRSSTKLMVHARYKF
jgi:hypothetical protein